MLAPGKLTARVPPCRGASCVTTCTSEFLLLGLEDAELLREMGTQSAVFAPESCARILRKPCGDRTPSDISFLHHNLVTALPFLRRLPEFVSHKLVRWLEWRRVEEGEVLARQGERADALYIVRHGELRAYRREQPKLTLADIFSLAQRQERKADDSAARRGSRPPPLQMLRRPTRPTVAKSELSTGRQAPQAAGLRVAANRLLMAKALGMKAGSTPPASKQKQDAAPASAGAGSGRSPGATTSPGKSIGGAGMVRVFKFAKKIRPKDKSAWVDPRMAEERKHAQRGHEDLVCLEPHPVHGDLVASFIVHDVAGCEAATGGVGAKFTSTIMAVRNSVVLAISKDNFMRECHHLRHRIVYAPARCRTTLMLPPSKRKDVQLEVVKECLRKFEVVFVRAAIVLVALMSHECATCQVFNKLPRELLATLARVAGYKRKMRNEIVVQQGDPDRSMLVFMSGSASLHHIAPDAAEAARVTRITIHDVAKAASRSRRASVKSTGSSAAPQHIDASGLSNMLAAARLKSRVMQRQRAKHEQRRLSMAADPDPSAVALRAINKQIAAVRPAKAVPRNDAVFTAARAAALVKLHAADLRVKGGRRTKEAPAVLCRGLTEARKKRNIWEALRKRGLSALRRSADDLDAERMAHMHLNAMADEEHSESVATYDLPRHSMAGICELRVGFAIRITLPDRLTNAAFLPVSR